MNEWRFIDFSPIPQFVLNREHRIIRWNIPCENLTGFRSRDMLGTKEQWKPFYAAPRPTLADMLLDHEPSQLERCLESKTIRRSVTVPDAFEESMTVELGGLTRNLHCIATLIVDADGGVQGAVESIQDITAQRQLEQELRQSNEDYRTLAENFPHGFLVTQDRVLVLVNRAFANLLGYPGPENIIGMNAADLIGEDHRDQFNRNLDLVVSGKASLRKNQWPHICRDGNLIWLEGHPRRISWRGRPALLSTLVDVTELRQKELQALEKSCPPGINNFVETNIRDRYRLGRIIGKSEAMREVYSLVLKAAARRENVIITGESGTGKEIVARTIHELSSRSERPFVPVNCGAIPADLFESEFFGYKKGAFTGAYADKPGFLSAAHLGTLFLDEVGDLPLNMQVKLLRVLDHSTYSPVGSSEIKSADIRVIAATNRDLLEHVQSGNMREDFFFRLYIIPIHMPPLRERKEDIPLLVEYFLSERHVGSSSSSFIPGYVMDALYAYDWPGNVRELQNTIQRFMTLGKLDMILSESRGIEEPAPGLFEDGSIGDLRKNRNRYEAELIRHALRQSGGNRSQAAAMLGISRKTFYRKLEKWNILDT
ncbi:MAG: sigma 54-interacting transcriptional regulator [Deltaproteobacteria bacterium]|nr:sigma 54-interacting transcriptional regulator [Deltaproteobacteria bacterium]